MTIEGTEGIVVKLATCCYPMPDDPIVGMIGDGVGLVVHAANCRAVVKNTDGAHFSWYDLSWAKDINHEFPALLKIQMEQGRFLISELVKIITNLDAVVRSVQIEEEDVRLATLSLKLMVRDRTHLARIMKRIRNIRSVIQLSREVSRNK